MNTFSEPVFTIKKFVVDISESRMSKPRPVVSAAPAESMLMFVAPMEVPRPICFALIPPTPVAALAPEALAVVWYKIS